MQDQRMYSVAEAARILRRTTHRVYQLMETGELISTRTRSGRRYLIAQEHLDALIKQRARDPLLKAYLHGRGRRLYGRPRPTR